MDEIWPIIGSKMKPSWDQNGIKNRCELRMAIFQKTLFFLRKNKVFGIEWVQVESQNRSKIDQKTESKMDGILASIFLGFWSILGGKLGGKPEPRSTQKGIEKRCKKEEQRDCQKSRNKNLQPRATPRVLGPGEGVGGGVNPSPREEGKGMRPVQRAKPPQPRGLVGFLCKYGFWGFRLNVKT